VTRIIIVQSWFVVYVAVGCASAFAAAFAAAFADAFAGWWGAPLPFHYCSNQCDPVFVAAIQNQLTQLPKSGKGADVGQRG